VHTAWTVKAIGTPVTDASYRTYLQGKTIHVTIEYHYSQFILKIPIREKSGQFHAKKIIKHFTRQ